MVNNANPIIIKLNPKRFNDSDDRRTSLIRVRLGLKKDTGSKPIKPLVDRPTQHRVT